MLSTSNSSATDLRDGEMMVKPTALHPMVSISNQIGALATGLVFIDDGSKKFTSLLNVLLMVNVFEPSNFRLFASHTL